MNNQNTTLLIAGIFSENSLKMVNLYVNKFNQIVISTYFDDKNVYLAKFKSQYIEILNSNVILVENTIPNVKKLHNSQNIYMQCFSTIEGLKQINTPYVVKLRSDEFYSSFDKLINTLPYNKISTSNVFVRDVSYKYLHLSDHTVVGGGKLDTA